MERKNKRIETLESNLNGGSQAGNSAVITELLQKVELLTNEMRKKDERIQALEAARHNEPRMEMVRKHGTIEDLVSKVAFLENELKQKEREVFAFQSLFPKSSKQLSQTNKPKQPSTSKASIIEALPPSQPNSQSTNTSTKTNKNMYHKENELQLTPMYESDTSPIAILQTSAERTPKRDHAFLDSDDSSGQPKNKVLNANASALSGDDGMSE